MRADGTSPHTPQPNYGGQTDVPPSTQFRRRNSSSVPGEAVSRRLATGRQARNRRGPQSTRPLTRVSDQDPAPPQYGDPP